MADLQRLKSCFGKLVTATTRQVGKSTAVRQLGKEFKYFVEVNLESQPSIKQLFTKDIDVHRTCEAISATNAWNPGSEYSSFLRCGFC